MILVDSSCWIDFFRPTGDPRVRAAVADALMHQRVATCGLVRVEILAFVRRADLARVTRHLDALHSLDTGPAAYAEAIAVGQAVRAGGHTVPATDLVIAATASVAGATLLHRDADFARIAPHAPNLQVRDARGTD